MQFNRFCLFHTCKNWLIKQGNVNRPWSPNASGRYETTSYEYTSEQAYTGEGHGKCLAHTAERGGLDIIPREAERLGQAQRGYIEASGWFIERESYIQHIGTKYNANGLEEF